ncbi:hypothetical protein [Cryobacterium sp. TMT3-29-2]|uniref:hypothetical protein n=1 Tax=Cryobacterium sp. TMT3-29-2 TaxID=2555867 RepID=UPI0010745B97|nr:hypothetical protein [Cryobacterium sp. TMT3-29-2]TFC94148.1 hypothetical protein E3O67_00330 [Cryobacterium sp. TMT3-29-2]
MSVIVDFGALDAPEITDCVDTGADSGTAETIAASTVLETAGVTTEGTAEWEYAQEGFGTVELEPGQSVGLVFTTGAETPTPGR